MTDIPWEAVATLVTGFLAVGAATLVAFKQTAIGRRQMRLQELSFRRDLFDRQMLVYVNIRNHLKAMTFANDFKEVADGGTWQAYRDALQEARFLFSHELNSQIHGWAVLIDRTNSKLRLLSIQKEGTPEYVKVEEEFGDLQAQLIAQYDSFPEIFDAEMTLRDDDSIKRRDNSASLAQRGSVILP